MNECNASTEQDELPTEVLPSGFTDGTTFLLASAGDPTQYTAALQILSEYGHTDETAVIITTITSAEELIDTYSTLVQPVDQLSMGIVDTVSRQQSLSALYNRTPIVFTPSPDDLERIIIALSDIADNHTSSGKTRHLILQSLTPILKTTATNRVCRFLKRITEFRSETGLCLLGLDYTAHNQDTIATIAERVDGIIWITQSSSGEVELEYSPAKGRYNYDNQ